MNGQKKTQNNIPQEVIFLSPKIDPHSAKEKTKYEFMQELGIVPDQEPNKRDKKTEKGNKYNNPKN